ncbi:hypothetical protein HQQ82_09255 [Rathayibacter sp. VKM Ac-2856]|uniref:hypothetical protein n=1 Tax=unclassified Rathayibacter TaxID=2609250 RepID=UPI0015635F80|nr:MULTISPECIES: hypothetical protein [unclassified Rathayibacter]NQX04985.1 hypothetical protein [Rathayibacter sp. VKM Ac-2858]NQX20153.1 hypothetical protein [Rathayibacter sp. VKM Ac-2856]
MTISVASREHYEKSLSKLGVLLERAVDDESFNQEDQAELVGRVNGLIEWKEVIEEYEPTIVFDGVVLPYVAWAASDLVPCLDRRSERWALAREIFSHAEYLFYKYSEHASPAMDLAPLQADVELLRNMIDREARALKAQVDERTAQERLRSSLEDYARVATAIETRSLAFIVVSSEHDPLYGTTFYNDKREAVARGYRDEFGNITYYDSRNELIGYYFVSSQRFTFKGRYTVQPPKLPSPKYFAATRWYS